MITINRSGRFRPRLRPRLGLDGEDSVRGYHDMAQVESFRRHIVEKLPAIFPKSLEELTDAALIVAAQTQRS